MTFDQVLWLFGYEEEVTKRFSGVKLPFTPMEHQIDGLHRVLYYPRFGLYFKPRTGKTLVMQMAAIFRCSFGDKVLQVMPPGLLYQFQSDYGRIKGHNLNIQTLNQTPARRKVLLERWAQACPDVVLLSPGMFKTHWRDLAELGFNNLHFDEAHLVLQDEKNQTYRAVSGFMRPANRRLILSTGTPIPNRIENAYGIVSLANPNAYASRRAFDAEHVVRKPIFVPNVTDHFGRPKSIQVVDHYINLASLSSRLYHRGIHIDQRSVLKVDAPNIQVIECALTAPHRALYRKVMRDRILELGDGEIIDARSAPKLRQTALQLISCPENYGGNPAHNSLYETLDDLIGAIEGKVLVFANFVRTVELLKQRFKSWCPVTVYGKNGSQGNAENVEIFRRRAECRMLIANPVAGGTGFTLGDVCTTVVFAEPVESPGAFEQCISRVLLVGQQEPIICYIVKAVDTISGLAIDHMVGKVKDINQVMRQKKTVFDVLVGNIQEVKDD